MGGVVNLLSRRPGRAVADRRAHQRIVAGRRPTPSASSPPARRALERLAAGGGHRQSRNDRDGDGGPTCAGYERGVVRPRLFWDGGNGRSAFSPPAPSIEDREGGTIAGRVPAATGAPYQEALDTRRYDVGGSVRPLLGGATS